MGAARVARHPAARRGLRARSLPRSRGQHDPRAVPLTGTVTFYVARDCHLCERARGELAALAAECGFGVDEVDITGIPDLERRYREWIPVIEVDGERVSVYRVEAAPLRHKLGLE
jgi:hypothetical protein